MRFRYSSKAVRVELIRESTLGISADVLGWVGRTKQWMLTLGHHRQDGRYRPSYPPNELFLHAFPTTLMRRILLPLYPSAPVGCRIYGTAFIENATTPGPLKDFPNSRPILTNPIITGHLPSSSFVLFLASGMRNRFPTGWDMIGILFQIPNCFRFFSFRFYQNQHPICLLQI